MKIELTRKQVKQLSTHFSAVRIADHNGERGMLVAQVHEDYFGEGPMLRVGFLLYAEARALVEKATFRFPVCPMGFGIPANIGQRSGDV